ncbi:beta-1,3-galactosyltransferase 5-like [Dreissena polymorpha]|uniref:beta-1,3-galactosyltransferase 5-like n=1 Tax=Dreissena polymorpha TaxID=45954 RepID=UPI002263F1EE|nr:beta-1,3-galactosyltransferase 5-like [Dreissena polymorpha]
MLKDVICPQGAFVVVLIKSEPERFKEREDVRNTWGSVTKVKGKTLVPVFTMGRSAFPLIEVDESLSLESERFKDIIQGDFVDHFKNQAYKTIMGLSWVVNSCLDVKFVLNTNDETMIDPFHMVDFLELQENADLLFCSTFYDQGPERNPSEKLFVTYKEFSYVSVSTYRYAPDESQCTKIACNNKWVLTADTTKTCPEDLIPEVPEIAD